MAIFYPISAMLTIFCNVIYDPLHPQVDMDLKLLEIVPDLVKQMRLRGLPRDETAQVKALDDFVAELARLGSQAITKAVQGNNGEG
jgi:hypothetical protein